jgi:pimeloyl-ACP methyl ester carboxylesterase
MSSIRHLTVRVSDLNVFARAAGDPARPALVLLHGFPSSSRHYIRLIDRLADHWHVVAPDYPGFGLSDPLPGSPTFDRLAEITGELLDTLGIDQYALYLFDFGAPVGFRIALAHDQRVRAVITQNANAHTDGFGPDVAALPAGGPTRRPDSQPSTGSSASREPGRNGWPAPATPSTSTPASTSLTRPSSTRSAAHST